MGESGSLELATVRNFRDVGGLAASNGNTVRQGRVFRSGDLSQVDDRDSSIVASLGLRRVIDLRDPVAWEKRPDNLAGLEVQLEKVDLTTRVHIELRDRWEKEALSESESLYYARAIYAAIPLERLEGIQQVFRLLSKGDCLPVLLHCSIGKDRTGIVIALILYALGIGEEVVLADYMLSNELLADFRSAQIRKTGWENSGPLWEARPEYLQTAVSAVRSVYGSMEAYLADGIGLTDTARASLQRALLQ